MTREPLTEDLSAYIDGELRGTERAELEEHLAGCETCRRRLDQLRGTVNEVRALPMESAPRPFSVPAQRRQQLSEPAWGRLGRLAAALTTLVVVIAGIGFLLSLRAPNGGGASTAGSAPRFAAGPANTQGRQAGASAPVDRASSIFTNSTTVSDPTDRARRLALETDSASYRRGAGMAVRAVLTGSTSQPVAGRFEVFLTRNGQAQMLMSSSNIQPQTSAIFSGSFAISSLPPTQQGLGTYTLVATWTYPDGRRALVAQLQIQIES